MSSWCCLIYKVLFAPGHRAAFSARSLECLYIISNPSPFVNTFFHFFCVFFQVLPSVFDIAGFQGDPSLFHYILLKNSSGLAARCSGEEKKGRKLSLAACVGVNLSSRAVASQVLSAPVSLTTVFEMGTGGPSP